MKKIKLILVALAAIPLVACSGPSKTKTGELSSGSKVTKQLVLSNNVSSGKIKSINKLAIPEGYEIVSQVNGTDFAFLQKDTDISLYLLTQGKILVAKVGDVSKTLAKQSYNFGAYISVENADGKIVTYAQNGTLIHTSKETVLSTVTSSPVAFVDYLTFDDDNVTYAFDGKDVKEIEKESIDNYFYSFSMEEYGKKEYTITCDYSLSLQQILVSKDGGQPTTYKLPYRGAPDFVLGNYFYYFESRELPDTSTDYQYSDSTKKYTDVVCRFDYTCGKSVETVLDFCVDFSTLELLKDENGFLTLGTAWVYPINADKTLDVNAASCYVLDADFKIYDDITLFALAADNMSTDIFENTQVVEEENKVYYIEQYDSNVVAVLDEKLNVTNLFTNSKVSKTSGVILSINSAGFSGMINFKGQVVVPFKYDSLYTSTNVDGSIIGTVKGEKTQYFTVKYGVAASNFSEAEIADIATPISFLRVVDIYGLTRTKDTVKTIEFIGDGTKVVAGPIDCTGGMSYVTQVSFPNEEKAYIILAFADKDAKVSLYSFEAVAK